MFYRWPSVAAFTAWHEAACGALDLPRAGLNMSTGAYDSSAMMTTAYTSAVTVAPGDVRAMVDGDVAALVPDGLGVPCDPPPAPPSLGTWPDPLLALADQVATLTDAVDTLILDSLGGLDV